MAFTDRVSAERGIAGRAFDGRRRWVVVSAGVGIAATLLLTISLMQPGFSPFRLGVSGDRPELQELIAAVAKDPTRPVSGRLSGGFLYAPPPSDLRGPAERQASPDVLIAVAKIEQAARTRRTSDIQEASGVSKLVTGELEDAVDRLQLVVADNPRRAEFSSDLSAALLARAVRFGRAEDSAAALAAANRALQLDPKLPEALFNRALALQRLGRTADERAAWQRYLDVERDPTWRNEAQSRLASIR